MAVALSTLGGLEPMRRAWFVWLPMHVVLEVREQDGRMLVFRDVCGKSFTVYEGS
jgi:hypothetical protein